MFGDQFQYLDIIICTIRCLTSIFLLMKIQFQEEKHRISKLLQLRKQANLVYLQNLNKLSLVNQVLILFEDFCKTPLTKCYDVLIQFPGKNRIKLQLRGYPKSRDTIASKNLSSCGKLHLSEWVLIFMLIVIDASLFSKFQFYSLYGLLVFMAKKLT